MPTSLPPAPYDLPGFAVRLTSQAIYDATRPLWIDPGIPVIIGYSPQQIVALTGAPLRVDPNYATISAVPNTPVYSQLIGTSGQPAPLAIGSGTIGGRAWAWQCSVELYLGGVLPAPGNRWQHKVGIYTGNGTSQGIAVGFQPQVVLVKPYANVSANGGAYMHAGMASGIGVDGGGLDATTITGFSATGFTVGNGAPVNTNNGKYFWLAISDPSNYYLNYGTYHGAGARGVSVTATFGSPNVTSAAAFLPSDNGRTLQFGTPAVNYVFIYQTASAGVISPACQNAGINVVYPATFLATDRSIISPFPANSVPGTLTHAWVFGRSAIYRDSGMPADNAVDLQGEAAGNPLTELIKSFGVNGPNTLFVVGSNNNVNAAALDYWWFTLSADAQLFATAVSNGSALGTGGAVSPGLPFAPGYVQSQQFVAGSNIPGYWRGAGAQAGTGSNQWGGTAQAANGISALLAAGFTLGTTALPNAITDYWAAFSTLATIASFPAGGTCPSAAIVQNLPYFSLVLPDTSVGTAPYTFALVAGSLPPGLVLNPLTGAISGTPTTLGTSSFSIRILDSTLSVANARLLTCSLTVTLAGNPGTDLPLPASSGGAGCGTDLASPGT